MAATSALTRIAIGDLKESSLGRNYGFRLAQNK